MKYLLAFVLLLNSSVYIFAQAQIKFSASEHDYGTIKEDGGLAETIFEFVNTGTAPLILNNVKATCGCTTPEWTKSPIAPNQKGSIKVTYNPQNRPGAFTKNVNVYSNTQPSVTVLTIKGKVEPRQKTVEELYPREMGPLRLKSNYLSLGTMYNADAKDGELEFINTSDAPAKIGIYRSPEYIKVKFVPEVVAPGKEGKILVNYDASQKNAYGYVSDRVYLTINDEKQNTYSIGISVSIQEDFSKLTAEQLAKAPVASFDEKVYDFGTINQGDKAAHNFKLTNKGKTDLILRNVKASCGCTAVKHADLVKPGETIEMAVEFNSRGKRSRQNKSITIITNDPKNATIQLRMMGNVEVPTTTN
ncbi:MAG: DUF1573 domain-containing protein [Prolixibacteraceae bacterium]